MPDARPSPPMTGAEFLVWEETQELRWEFDGSAPVAKTGDTVAHEVIRTNLVSALLAKLRGTPCRVHGCGLKVKVAGCIRYPDAFIACSPVDPRRTVREDPVVVFEVLGVGTAYTERIEKMRDYWNALSIRRYVLIEQEGAPRPSCGTKGAGRAGCCGPATRSRCRRSASNCPCGTFYEGLDSAALREPPPPE